MFSYYALWKEITHNIIHATPERQSLDYRQRKMAAY